MRAVALVRVDLDRKDGYSNSDLVAAHEALVRCVETLDKEDLEGGPAAQARLEALEAMHVDEAHQAQQRSSSRPGALILFSLLFSGSLARSTI